MYNTTTNPVRRYINEYLESDPDASFRSVSKDAVEKIKEYYDTNKVVKNGKIKPFTPFKLIEEISQQIPFNCSSRVLVFYTPEWGAYLHLFTPVLDVNITVATTVYNQKILALCNMHGLKYDTLDKIADQINKGEIMKFDVIVGNPPFQSEKRTGTQPLWPLFVEQGFKLLKPDGHLAMITPNKWCGHTTNVIKGKIKLYRDRFRGKLTYCNIQECSKHFPGVGGYADCFSYFVINNAGSTKFTAVTKSGKFVVNSDQFEFLPINYLSPLASSILKKVKTNNTFNFKQVSVGFENSNSGAVVISMAQRLHYDTLNIYYDKNSSFTATSKSTVSGVTSTNSSQEIIDSIFRSKLFKFLHKIFWNNDNFGTTFYNSLPFLDISKKWSDEEIFNYFKLSKSEVEYIDKILSS